MTAGYLDTNVVIGFFKGEDAVRVALERFDSLKIPALAYAEFLVGLHHETHWQAADKAINSLFEIVHTSSAICKEAAELKRRTSLKLPDALIYATARVGGGVLVTRDGDFDPNWRDVVFPH